MKCIYLNVCLNVYLNVYLKIFLICQWQWVNFCNFAFARRLRQTLQIERERFAHNYHIADWIVSSLRTRTVVVCVAAQLIFRQPLLKIVRGRKAKRTKSSARNSSVIFTVKTVSSWMRMIALFANANPPIPDVRPWAIAKRSVLLDTRSTNGDAR